MNTQEKPVDQLSIKELTILYNKTAEKLGLKMLKAFKDRPTALSRVAEILEKEKAQMERQAQIAPKKQKSVVAPKEKKTEESDSPVVKEPRTMASTHVAKPVKRITRKMFRRLYKVPGKKVDPRLFARHSRWDNYKDGMTMYEVITGEGMEAMEVLIYVDWGLMTLEQPTEESIKEDKERLGLV